LTFADGHIVGVHAVRAIQVLATAIQTGEVKISFQCGWCSRVGPIKPYIRDYSKPKDVVWMCPKCFDRLRENLRNRIAQRLGVDLSIDGMKLIDKLIQEGENLNGR